MPIKRRTVRTLPEQIADDLGATIARGDFATGHRLLEQELAEQFGVSRGPVREALRLLETRGLADISPRRGASVVAVTLDSVVDLFNTRAVLMGLAARYFAIMATEPACAELSGALGKLLLAAHAEDTDPTSFLRETSRVGLIVSRNCGSDSLGKLIEHQNQNSAWGSLWLTGQIDFATRARRLAAAGDYADMGAAIEARDGAKAEATMRLMVMRSRESAAAFLGQLRGQSFDERRLLTA